MTNVKDPLPRVLYVVAMDPSCKFGSLEEQMAFSARLFQEHGSLFMPLFVCSKAPHRPTPIEEAGVSIACLDSGVFHLKVLLQLLNLIRRHRIDLVHWNFFHPLRNRYVWWLTLLRPRLTHLYTDHISRPFPLPTHAQGWKLVCKRLLLKRYVKVLSVSHFVANCLKGERSWSNIVCCPYFVNTARFRPSSDAREKTRAKFGATKCFVVLVVAHLIKPKGIDVLLRALGNLPSHAVLWVVGTGTEAAGLRQLAMELGVAKRVIFHGPQQHVESYMQAADCFVCPSLWAEAAGLVNLEAQSTGLPVIASNIGGIPEYVADGETGLLFPAGDTTELTERIHRVMTDALLRERLGRSARRFMEGHFSPDARLDDLVAAYHSTIARC
jgi:glycosyltransferase involved in cell wall biosynthesis